MLTGCLLVLSAAACDEERFGYQELFEGCVRRNACDVLPYARVTDCISAYYELQRPQGLGRTYAGIYRCVNEAGGSCLKIRACFGMEATPASCDASFIADCQGQQAVSCDLLTHELYKLDCAASDLRCGVSHPPTEQFEARCTIGGCSPGEPRRCDGDRLLSCIKGLWEVTACDARGLTCGVSAGGGTECIGPGEACRAADRCEGNTAIRCVGGHEARQPCAEQPLASRCQEGRCLPAGGACLDELDRCQGEALELCLDGQWTQLDCGELGLGPCQASARGAACAGR